MLCAAACPAYLNVDGIASVRSHDRARNNTVAVVLDWFHRALFHPTTVRPHDLSRARVHRYARSKEHIVRSVMEQISADLNQEVGSIVRKRIPFPEKLYELILFTATVLERTNTEFLRDSEERYPATWDWYQAGRRERVERLYGRLTAAGSPKDCSDERFAELWGKTLASSRRSSNRVRRRFRTEGSQA